MTASLIIEIVPMGNLANRLIQYLAAIEIQRRVSGSILSNVSLPEIDLVVPRIEFDLSDAGSLTLLDHEYLDIDKVVILVERHAIRHIRLWNYCQRITNFPALETCRQELSPLAKRAPPVVGYGDDTLVINVRAAEILDGIVHYPLLPIDFYTDIVRKLGKIPVFMGQLDDSDYCAALRAAFPGAEFRPSGGIYHDFELMRASKHLVLSISTFSWLAAWVSDAATIILPMVGLFNRCYMPDTDLLPLSDQRYQFWSFPLYFGMPSPEFLLFEGRLAGRWSRQSPERVRHILENRPLLALDPNDALQSIDPFMAGIYYKHDLRPVVYAGPFNAIFDRKPTESYRLMDFDWYFYCHEYPDAGRDIVDGWYSDAFHHYVAAGRQQGYLPRPVSLPNISQGKKASLSSVADDTLEGTAEIQAARVLEDGQPEGYAFRTRLEPSPWWMVDLGENHEITDMYVHNRDDGLGHASAAVPLDIEFSDDGAHWKRMHTVRADRPFGDGSKNEFLRWFPRPSVQTRFIRVIVRRETTLHLRSIKIYGQPKPAH